VNCIQPGYVAGERIDRVIDAKAKALGVTSEAMRDRLLDSVSLRTFVTAQDIANTALFLATDAGRHISGQALPVCGDVRYLI
jgi:NAD(P)-dependent dehydrogenase (short-subunit alcohol dehydrogenase family)